MISSRITVPSHVQSVPLKDMATGGIVFSDLWFGLSAEQLTQLSEIWKPISAAVEADDSQWHWSKIKNRTCVGYDNDCYIYTIVFGNIVQGVVFVNQSEKMRSRGSRSCKALVVAYIAAAPWNRRMVREDSRFRLPVAKDGTAFPYLVGVGKTLIAFASSLSKELGHGGRLIVEAVPNAVDFYQRRCHFIEVPSPTSESGLIRMELTSMGVQRFSSSPQS